MLLLFFWSSVMRGWSEKELVMLELVDICRTAFSTEVNERLECGNSSVAFVNFAGSFDSKIWQWFWQR